MQQPLSGKSIMVVDDEPELLTILVDEMSLLGAEVIVAKDGLEAVELLGSVAIDVVITDLSMPRMNGLQLIGFIKANVFGRQPRVIVITGVTKPPLEKLAHLGVIEMLEKPADCDEIVARVIKVLKPQRLKVVAYHPTFLELLGGAAVTALQAYVPGLNIRPSYLKTNDAPLGAVSALLPIFGYRLHGSLCLAMDDGFLSLLAHQMFGDDAKTLPAETWIDIVGEMANQVGGELKRRLEERHVSIAIGLPEVLQRPAPIRHKVAAQTLAIPIMAGPMRCSLEACFGQGFLGQYYNEDETQPLFLLEAS